MENIASEDGIVLRLRQEFAAETYAASRMALRLGLLHCGICASATAKVQKNGRYCCGACAKRLEMGELAQAAWMDKASRPSEQGQATQL